MPKEKHQWSVDKYGMHTDDVKIVTADGEYTIPCMIGDIEGTPHWYMKKCRFPEGKPTTKISEFTITFPNAPEIKRFLAGKIEFAV